MSSNKIPKTVIERIPFYINYLDRLIENNVEMTSSKIMADELCLGEVQVRKDLNLISGKGKPKIGYNVKELRDDFERLVRDEDLTRMIIVGAGKIGEGLANYKGFQKSGFELMGIFDNDINKIGKKILNLEILPEDQLKNYCHVNKIDIGIITVPSTNAQKVCNDIVLSGVKGILNFTNVKLEVPEGISVRNVDISSLLTMLAIEIKNN